MAGRSQTPSVQTDTTTLTGSGGDVSSPVPRVDPAQKLDTGKLPVYQGFIRYFPRAIEEITKVSLAGAKKYNIGVFPTRWKEVPNGELRYADAHMRHMLEEAKGTLVDEETKCYHLAQQIWNDLARLELFLANNGDSNDGT